MKAGERLTADLAALRQRPGVDLPTLRAVNEVMDAHAGSRLTVPAPTRHTQRVAQAKALLGQMPSGSKVANMRALAAALGVHLATAYRLVAASKPHNG